MATEPNKIEYGGDMMLFLGTTLVKRPVAFSTSAKLEINLDTREISSKDSGYWKEKQAGRMGFSAGSDALYTEPLSGGLKTGIIGTSTANKIVDGTGTEFLTELSVGDQIRRTTGVLIGVVASIESDIACTLVANAATTNAGIAYWAEESNSYDMLYASMIARVPIAMIFGAKLGSAPANSVDTAKKYFAGSALITALSVNAADNDTTTYSVSLEGSGSLILT